MRSVAAWSLLVLVAVVLPSPPAPLRTMMSRFEAPREGTSLADLRLHYSTHDQVCLTDPPGRWIGSGIFLDDGRFRTELVDSSTYGIRRELEPFTVRLSGAPAFPRLYRTGLRDGDVLVAVSGRSLTLDSAMRFFWDVDGRLDLTFQRGNVRFDLVVLWPSRGPT